MRFQIRSPSRLHLSLIDLNGVLGRIDGGFGFAINYPNFVIEFNNKEEETINEQNNLIFEGPQEYIEQVKQIIAKIQAKFNVKYKSLKISVKKSIPAHVGLGSKTQFLLSIAKGLCYIKKINLTNKELASLVERGGTSGIGYQIFEEGGFILDLGHSFGKNGEKKEFLPSSASKTQPAMPFFHHTMPENWNILLLIPNVKQGANNLEERNIFQDFTPIPLQDVEKISHRILMQIIPSIVNKDLKNFAEGIHFINNHGFKKIEISLQHECISKLIEDIYSEFKVPVGISSFGPGVFVITESDEKSKEIYDFISFRLEDQVNSPGGKIIQTKPNNSGFSLKVF
ncbi:MAG: beta-ribofuranosylaminobenzene 5'-phosphate synthase [Promethearchaeota archaeon]